MNDKLPTGGLILNTEHDRANTILTSEQGAILVDGIEQWITTLTPVVIGGVPSVDGALFMQDTATGAVFLIKRVQ